MSAEIFRGILCIGDPHLCSWPPGYRKDDYPEAVFQKLQWALEYAREKSLLPVLLGDLFHVPRDNANWLLARVIELLRKPVLTIIGNHDLSEDQLSENDSLQVLLAAGRLSVLDDNPWVGSINDVPVAIGGTSNGRRLPRSVDRSALGEPRWVVWVTHHDVLFPGYEDAGRESCAEVPGVDLVINGHIHRHLEDVTSGQTTWCNPGNISRVSRSDATRAHKPGVLQIDVRSEGLFRTRVPVPHNQFDEAFYPVEEQPVMDSAESKFIAGLQTMRKFKTADGEGLRSLIEASLPGFSNERVRREIQILLKEVLPHANITERAADDRGAALPVRAVEHPEDHRGSELQNRPQELGTT